MYYQRFLNNDFIHSKYNSGYCGSSESWPQSAWTGSIWDITDSTGATNFANFGGWSWTSGSGNINLFETCNSASSNSIIFGGSDNFGNNNDVQKHFKNLPSHDQVEVSLKFYFIDEWITERFFLSVDATQIIVSDFEWWRTDFNNNYCGSSCNDLINQEFSGKTSHSSSTMTIYFTTGLLLDVSVASYGFKDFNVYLYNHCDNSCVTCSVNNSPTSCTSCYSFAQLSGNICTCRDKFYFATSSGVPAYCAKCNVACATCSGGADNECSSCYSGWTLSNGVCTPAPRKFF